MIVYITKLSAWSYQIIPYEKLIGTLLNLRCCRDPCQVMYMDILLWGQGRRWDFPTKEKSVGGGGGGEGRQEGEGKKTSLFFYCHKSVLKFHASVAFCVPHIFLLPSCLTILASPVAQILWTCPSTDLRAAALRSGIALLETLRSPSFSHCHIICSLLSVRKAMGIWYKANFISLVFPVQRLEKLANFRNILVFEVLGSNVSKFSTYLRNYVFNFLLFLAFEVVCIAEFYSDL